MKQAIPRLNAALTRTKGEQMSVCNSDSTSDRLSRYQCPICLEYTQEDSLYALHTCGCIFCRKCLETYITTALNLYYDHHLNCPNHSCQGNGKLGDSEILSLVPTSVYNRYELLKLQRAIDKNSILTYCPKNNCSSLCRISPSQPLSLTKLDHMDKHVNNGTFFHRLCSFVAYGRNGSELKKQLDSKSDFPSSRMRPTSNTARFPEASPLARPALPVVCPKCGYQFCARCHSPWHSGEAPFPCDFANSQSPAGGVCHPFAVFCQQRISSVKRLFSPRLGTAHFQPAAVRTTRGRLSVTPNVITTQSSVQQQEQVALFPVPAVHIVRESGWHEALLTYPSGNDTESGSVTSVQILTMFPSWEAEQSLLTGESRQGVVELPVGFPPYPPDAQYKRCPACLVPVERADGCAQMCCQSCKRTFCWHCLASLDSDFLLRHFDSGTCRGKLGHSQASLFRHRLYVVITVVTFILLAILSAPIAVFVMIYLTCRDFYQVRRLQHRRRVIKSRLNDYAISGGGDGARTLVISSPKRASVQHANSSGAPGSLSASVDKGSNIAQALIHWNYDNYAASAAADNGSCDSYSVDLESGVDTTDAASYLEC